jgi:tetratricopeptide (TPR) repeat protein
MASSFVYTACTTVLCSLLSMANVVSAEKTVNQAQAKIVFEKAETDYRLSRFEDALAGYMKAYELYPVAEFLFNIGQCHRNLNNYEQAIFSFNAYVRDADSPKARLRVKKLIASLKQSLAKAKAEEETAQKSKVKEVPDTRNDEKLSLSAPPPAVLPNVDTQESVYSKWWLWTSVLIVSVALGGGIYVASEPTPAEGTLGAVDWQ